MNAALEAIIKAKQTKSYIDFWKYHKDNIFGITKKSRDEHLHSNFLAWILDGDSYLVPNYFCLYNFVLAICLVKSKPENINARGIDDSLEANFCSGNYIISAKIQREVNNIDILIQIKTTDKILPIIIENKVKSPENGGGKQTDKYFDWAEKEFNDSSLYFKPIYVWLCPRFKKLKPHNSAFLTMEYQDIVERVIEPAMNACNNDTAKNNILIYLQCLSFQTDNTKGDKIMAISSAEKEIIRNFINENKELIGLVVESLEVSDDVKAAIRNGMDTTEYILDNEKIRKTHLLSKIVEKYIRENKPKSYSDIVNKFNKIGKKNNNIKETSNISEKDKRRYDYSQLFNIDGVEFAVTNQWSIGDMQALLEMARNDLGYSIEIAK